MVRRIAIWLIAPALAALLYVGAIQLTTELGRPVHLFKSVIPAIALALLCQYGRRLPHYRTLCRSAVLSLCGLALMALSLEGLRLLPYASSLQGGVGLWRYLDPWTLGGALMALLLAVVPLRRARKGAQLTRGGNREAQRARDALHGDARYMSLTDAAALLPDGPGIVLGERYRADLDDTAGDWFDPRDRASWGRGGKSPLLCFDAGFGSTHGLIFAGSGAFKTTGLVIPTLLRWPSSAVVLDPSREIAPMVRAARAQRFGKDALILDPAAPHLGFNVLSWIDRSDAPEKAIAETASWLASGRGGEQEGSNAEFFAASATQLITGVLAHLMLDPGVPPSTRTLRGLRAVIAAPEPKLKAKLETIFETSPHAFVRETVGPFIKMVDLTFSGVYANASKDTQWISFPAFGELVSGGPIDIERLTRGEIDIYLNMALEDIRNHPGLGRVVVGALLNTIIKADGGMVDRVLFVLDEAATIGRMKAIETARDQGRKYGLSLMMIYQAVGQLKDVWGRNALSTWSESASYRIFAAINDVETAETLSKMVGTYTVQDDSRTRTTSSSVRGLGTVTAGSNTTARASKQKRSLLMAHEILSDMRTDEQLVFLTGRPPLRCGRPLYFRRKDMLALVDDNRFHRAPARAAQ